MYSYEIKKKALSTKSFTFFQQHNIDYSVKINYYIIGTQMFNYIKYKYIMYEIWYL